MTWKSGAGHSSASKSGSTARIRFGGRVGKLAAASLAVVLISANFAFIAENVGITPAAADTAPADPSVPETVSAAALPTVQINGVVWDQVIVGNRVFVTGQFTQARPAGADPGTNETPRSNILAYDLTTGELITDVGTDAERAGPGDQGVARRIDDLCRWRLRPRQRRDAQPHRRARRADRRAASASTPHRTRPSTRSRSRATPSTSAATSRPIGLAAIPRTRLAAADTTRRAPSVGADRRPHRQHDGRAPGQRPRDRRWRFQHAQRFAAVGHGLPRRDHGRRAAVGREHGHQEPRLRRVDQLVDD